MKRDATAPLFRLILLLALGLLALSPLACSDNSGDDPPADGDTPDGDDGDEPDGDDPDGDVFPGFRLGYAEVDITPYPEFERVLMGSYGIPGIGRAMVGVHDPLMAQVALFTNAKDEMLMLIAVDLCGYAFNFGEYGPGVRHLREVISETLADETGLRIAPEEIVIAPSHNHTSTDLVGLHWDIRTPMPLELLEWHITKITGAALEAARNLKNVELRFSVFDFPGYAGRDEDPPGSGVRCSEITDDRVHVMQAHTPEGELLLTMANFAKHPTLIEWTLKEATADYIWAYRLEVEEQAGGKAMFIQGFIAATHTGPAYDALPGPPDSYEKAENFGRLFAQNVLEHAQDATLATQFDIETREAIISLPTNGFFNDVETLGGMKLREASIGENGKYVLEAVPVSWRRLGPAQFVTWPGEAAPEYSLLLRGRMDTDFAFMVGLGNEQLGYFIPPESLDLDPTGKLARYEARMGPGIGAGELILEALDELGFLPPEN